MPVCSPTAARPPQRNPALAATTGRSRPEEADSKFLSAGPPPVRYFAVAFPQPQFLKFRLYGQELTRPDHSYLTADDECFFLGEYTARKGYAYSDTNNLVINLKKPMDRKGLPEWRYKGIAIRDAARAFRDAIVDQLLRAATFVPIPPSKAKDDPLYDGRMSQLIRAINNVKPLDCREMILQVESTVAAHDSDDRPSPDELQARYSVDANLIEPRPSYIIVLDDLLTTGSHFKAAKNSLQRVFPEVPIVGYFVARRVPDTTDIEAFFDDLDLF